MVKSADSDKQITQSAPWLSNELATNIEADAALQELLTPVQRWLSTLSVRNHSPHTLTAYFAALNQLALFLRGKRLTWTRCDKRQLAQHISQRLDEDKLALASVQQELSAIRHFYGWLIEEGVARINPTTGYQLKRSPRPLPSIADVDLLTQLLDQQIPDTPEQARLWLRDKAMFELLYSSGLRVGELVALDIEDIDLTDLRVRVTGKGNKTRLVPIGSKAATAITRYLPHRNLWVEQMDSALFISEKLGTRLSTRALDSQCMVIGATQGGDHMYKDGNTRQTWGHTTITTSEGCIAASYDHSELKTADNTATDDKGYTIVMASFDKQAQEQSRQKLPIFNCHRLA